uniref:Uncharacterized protein n=1 Tax=Panagrolaimus sp. PS1159 TaxID=55785 RepID=A0AC35FXZ3_9BILA
MKRFSPYASSASQRQTTREARTSAAANNISSNFSANRKLEQQQQNVEKEVIEHSAVEVGQTYVMDDSVSPREIGAYVESLAPTSNYDIMEVLPDLTNEIPSLDAYDPLVTNLTAGDVKNTLVGLCVMVNRLLQDNRFLLRELAAIKSGSYSNSISRMERYDFKKRLIRGPYIFHGTAEIPKCDLMTIVTQFDLAQHRRTETSLGTIRRFVRFLLENVIPHELHTKYTLRERGGQDYLTEIPPDLLILIRDMCLEALNLFEPRMEEDRTRREDFSDYINRTVKSALQEMRRNPRKNRVVNKEA